MIDSPATPVPAVRRDLGSNSPEHRDIAPVAGSYHVRQVVDTQITPNDYPRLISVVRALAPDSGTARELGDGLQWEHDSGFTSLSLTINPEPSGTVIRADIRADGERVAYGVGVGLTTFLTTLGAISAHWSGVEILGVSAATLLGGGWVAMQLIRLSHRRRAAALEGLVAKIAAGLRGDLD